jgi:hypothetical protein
MSKQTKIKRVKLKQEATPPATRSTLPAAPEQAESLDQVRSSAARALTNVQVRGSIGAIYPDNEVVQRGLQEGAVGMLEQFAPTDAVESTLAPVIVALKNAVMMSLGAATRVETRDMELNAAFRGASVLVELVQAYDAHRGNGKRQVLVGNVKVEAGAQAIVGNVETRPGSSEHAGQPGPVERKRRASGAK